MAAKAPSPLRNQKVATWKIPGFDDPFVQDPLTFFEKNELLALVSRAIEEIVYTTGDITGIVSLLGMDEKVLDQLREGKIDAELIAQTPGMIAALTRMISMVPGLMEDLYLLALSTPPDKREPVREGLRMIDDDTGFGILDTFVDQNVATLRDFFPRWRDSLQAILVQFNRDAKLPTSIDSKSTVPLMESPTTS